MAEVSRIQGPSGPPEPQKRDKPVSNDEKFKKMMRVEETDEKQKKKKRERAEEEEPKEEQAEAAAPLAKGAPSLYDIEPTGKSLSGISSKTAAPETTRPERLSQPSPFAPVKPEPPPEAPPGEEGVRSRTVEQRQPSSRTTSQERPSDKKTEEAPSENVKAADKKERKHTPETKREEKIQLPKVPVPAPEELAAVIPEDETEDEEEIEEITAAPLAGAENVEEKTTKEEQKEIPPLFPVPSSETLIGSPLDFTPAVPLSTPPYAMLPPAMLDLFERMVGVISIIADDKKGVTKYEFNLNAPPGSALHGMQIIIEEFSTAPKAFNVQLLGSQAALNMVNDSKNNFLAAFQSGNYNFRINRIETGYLPEEKQRPIARRRVSSAGDKGDKEREPK